MTEDETLFLKQLPSQIDANITEHELSELDNIFQRAKISTDELLDFMNGCEIGEQKRPLKKHEAQRLILATMLL